MRLLLLSHSTEIRFIVNAIGDRLLLLRCRHGYCVVP